MVKVGDKAYVWVEGQQPVRVGEMPASLYNDLAGEMRPKKALSVTAEDVDQLKITAADGKTHEFRKEKDTWTYVTDSFIKIDPEKVKDYVKDAVDISVKVRIQPPALPERQQPSRLRTGEAYRLVVLEQAGPEKDTRYGSSNGVRETCCRTRRRWASWLDDFRKKAAGGPPPECRRTGCRPAWAACRNAVTKMTNEPMTSPKPKAKAVMTNIQSQYPNASRVHWGHQAFENQT